MGLGDYVWDAVNPLAGGSVEVGGEVVNGRGDVILVTSDHAEPTRSYLVHLTLAEAELLEGRLRAAREASREVLERHERDKIKGHEGSGT